MFKLTLSAVLLVAWIVLLSWSKPFGVPLPAVGAFFQPATGFWHNATNGQTAKKTLQLDLSDNRARGSVVFDADGVPHIQAENREQAAWLQGYVTAADRLWQMDISIRASGGYLAEVMGPDLAERDEERVRLGFREAARRELAVWQTKPAEIAVLDAYTAGVNAYVATLAPADYPLEYKLIGYAPQPWSNYKSALFLKYMADMLCRRNSDQDASATLAALGKEQLERYFPLVNPAESPVIPVGTYPADSTAVGGSAVSSDASPDSNAVSYRPGRVPERYSAAIGSNNWAVGPERTLAGHPLLANDPHLGLSLPSIWYEIQIQTPEFSCYGFSLPGSPGVIIGFNEHIAWGITNAGIDVLDYYQVQFTDTTRTAYLLDGVATPLELRPDTVRVSGGEERYVSSAWTVFGPIVETTVVGTAATGLATRWAALDTPEAEREVYATGMFQQLMAAQNHADYRRAVSGQDAPASNLVFAARDGDIALSVTGRLPLRQPGEGRFVRSGDKRTDNWPGFIPKADLPHVLNPPRGFVGSANQRSTESSYPYYYLGYFEDYRGRYLNRELAKLDRATPQQMQQLQLADLSLKAEEMLPALLALFPADSITPTRARALDSLRTWDYRYGAESNTAALFERWGRYFYWSTVDEFDREAPGLALETWQLIELLREQPTDLLFDVLATPARETAADLLPATLDSALIADHWDDGETPTPWRESLGARIPHLGRIPGLGLDQVATLGGVASALNAQRGNFGPSFRMVVELDDPVRAWVALPGGPSGNPAAAAYDSGVADWANGRYRSISLEGDLSDGVRWTFE
ncbi:MAG: penicillin acylase family protein [Saprospiraceae bacterium]